MTEEVKNTKTKEKKENNQSFAVIKTGGKQYIVSSGSTIFIEKLDNKEGDKIKFDVLLKSSDAKLEIGTPNLETKVEGKVVSQTKGDKIIVFKYKKRKNYRVKTGHRQKLTRVEITSI